MRRIIAVSLLTLLTAGCSEEGWLAVTIEARGIAVPDELDELEVLVVASQTPSTEEGEAQTCRAGQASLPETGELELPTTVLVVPGDSEWRCVAFRVIGLRGGDEVIRTESLYCVSLETTSEAALSLDAACHTDHEPPACGPYEVCRSEDGVARCVPSDASALFELPPSVDRRCDGR